MKIALIAGIIVLIYYWSCKPSTNSKSSMKESKSELNCHEAFENLLQGRIFDYKFDANCSLKNIETVFPIHPEAKKNRGKLGDQNLLWIRSEAVEWCASGLIFWFDDDTKLIAIQANSPEISPNPIEDFYENATKMSSDLGSSLDQMVNSQSGLTIHKSYYDQKIRAIYFFESCTETEYLDHPVSKVSVKRKSRK